MEKNILNEISRLQDLMDINTKPLINEKKNTEKRLISEIKLKPKLNFPDVKSFDNFKNTSKFKSIGGLLDFNFKNLKGFTSTPQNIDGLIKHLTDFKPIWVASLVDGGDSIEGATDAINSSLSTLKKIKNKTLKRNLGDLIPGKSYRVYETIPEEGGLRNAVLDQYKKTYGKTEWDNFKKLLSTNTAELKKIETGVKGVSDSIKNATVPKVKGTTPKGATPKGTTPTISPSGKYNSGSVGYTIETTIDPATGKGYDVKSVQDEFGSTGLKSDNTKLKNAWDEGWRPGQEVPEKYQTATHKAKKETESLIEIEDSKGKTTMPDDIFKSDKWNDIKDIKLSEAEIKTLVDRSWWDKVVMNIKAFFGFTEEKLIYLKKLTLAIDQTDQGTAQFSKLLTLYEKELKSLFKKSFNSFVNMRNYIDNIKDYEFQKVWTKIKQESKGKWLDEFGTLSKHVPAIEKLGAGLKNNFLLIENYEKYLTKLGKNILGRLINKISGGKAFGGKLSGEYVASIGDDVFSNLTNLFFTGSKSGFPTMGNPRYADLIKNYGMGAARISYLKDLMWNKLKYAILFSLATYTRDLLSDKWISGERTRCDAANKAADERYERLLTRFKVGKIEEEDYQKSINEIELYVKDECSWVEGWFDELIVKWSKNVRPDLSATGKRKEESEYFYNVFMDYLQPKIDKEKKETDWRTKDPGFLGEFISFMDDFINYDDPNTVVIDRQKKWEERYEQAQKELDKIEEEVKTGKNTAQDKVEDKVEDVKDKIENKKQEENKTTVTPGQTLEYLNEVLKNRTDGGTKWVNLSPIDDIKYKGNPVWGLSKNNIVYLYSIDTNNIVYEKKFGKEKWNSENVVWINSDSGWVPVKSSITVSEAVYRKIKKLMLKEMRVGNRRIIFEEKDEKFGEEKFEHWKKTFEFSSQDPETKEWKRIEKETIESKQVDIEKWVEHYLKSNDEDDAFVRAVIHVFKMDKNEKNHVKKVAFNKGLAHLSENFEVGGLLRVLSVIRESKELEIWSVKYYADGNWELVKGSFTDDELKNVGKTVREREKKDEERKKPVEGLKKKELTGIQLLNQDEKKGLVELPSQVKRKLLEKLRKGWVTEKPYEFFNEFYSVSDINTVFNDKLKIYKLNPTKEFFESLVQNSPRIFPRKGICKALDNLETTEGSNEKSKSVLKHILQKCQTKFKGEYGVKQTKTN
jgi:hypothetical protein